MLKRVLLFFGLGCTMMHLTVASALAQETAPVTEEAAFEAVFADPGNILLNFQLASIQLKNGNLKEASGTLERILILLPDNAEAQSLLASVQLRLGNKPESERLSNLILENDTATAAQKQEAKAIIAQLESERNAYNFTGLASFGTGVSDNPIGGSRGNKADGGGELLDKPATAEEFTTANLNINLQRRLISQLPQDVNLSLSMTTKDYATYDAGDLSTIGLTAAYSDTFQSGLLRTSFGATRIHIADKHYMNSYDARATYIQSFDDGLSGTIGASLTRQVLKGTNTNKTGNIEGLSAGIAKTLSNGRLSLDTRYNTSDMTEKQYGKVTKGVTIGYSTQALPGLTSISLDYAADKYKDENTGVSTKTRDDKTSSIRASYLIGLESFGPPNGSEAFLQVAAKYSSTKSNIENYTKLAGEASVSISQPF